MTDLERQAEEYAKAILADYPSVFGMLKRDICPLIAEAYEQGWVDRGRKGFNDGIAKWSDFTPDCTYHNMGFCQRGIPNIPCSLKGCVGYTPKNEKNRV